MNPRHEIDPLAPAPKRKILRGKAREVKLILDAQWWRRARLQAIMSLPIGCVISIVEGRRGKKLVAEYLGEPVPVPASTHAAVKKAHWEEVARRNRIKRGLLG